MKKLITLFLCLSLLASSEVKLKVYLVTSTYDYQRIVHKIYLNKDKAKKYIEMFKENHNYSLEEMDINE